MLSYSIPAGIMNTSPEIYAACQSLAKVGGWQLEASPRKLSWTLETYRIHEIDESFVPEVERAIAFYVPEAQPLIREALDATLEAGRPFELELEIETAQGNRIWVHSTGRAHWVDGKIEKVYGAIQDITQRKRLEEEVLRAQRMESIGSLAGGIAHDLNNILAPILVSAEMLQNQWDRESVDAILSNAERGADMVNQILTFARGATSRRQPVQVAEVIRHLTRLVRETFPRDIDFQVQCPADLPFALTDPTHLHQILVNLCVNARDAMVGGGVLKVVAEADRLQGQPAVALRVIDDGGGIPEALQEKIFEAFFTTKDVGRGTGLGLATVQKLVKQYSGHLELHSQEGEGTTFVVRLPASSVGAPKAAQTESPRLDGAQREVLVVDDERSVCAILEKVLKQLGFRVCTANSSREAIEVMEAKQSSLSLVITDIMMPGGSAVKFLLRLREVVPELPVLAISGMPDSTTMEALGDLQVPNFLAKPFNVESLVKAVREVLGELD